MLRCSAVLSFARLSDRALRNRRVPHTKPPTIAVLQTDISARRRQGSPGGQLRLTGSILTFLERAFIPVRLAGCAVLDESRYTISISVTGSLFAGVSWINTGPAVEGVRRIHGFTGSEPVAVLHCADAVVRIALHTLGHWLLIAVALRSPWEGLERG